MEILLFYVNANKKQPYLSVQEDLCRDYKCSLEAVRETLVPAVIRWMEPRTWLKTTNPIFCLMLFEQTETAL